MRANGLLAGVLLGASSLWAAGAVAAPVYMGYSVNGGTITSLSQCDPGNGTCTVPTTTVSTGLYVSGTVEGTPPLPEPDLMSTSLDFSGGPNTGTETISLYVTELNQETLNFNAFITAFTAALNAADLPPGGNSFAGLTLSDYVTNCSVLVAGGCAASYAYAEGQLLATTTFNSLSTTPSTVIDATALSSLSPSLGLPFATTEVYTVTFNPGYGDVQTSIGITVPEPASMALLGTGLLGLGLLRRGRRA